MAKSNSKSSSSSSNRGTNRPKPMVAKAGYTQTRRRYECGGKVKK